MQVARAAVGSLDPVMQIDFTLKIQFSARLSHSAAEYPLLAAGLTPLLPTLAGATQRISVFLTKNAQHDGARKDNVNKAL